VANFFGDGIHTVTRATQNEALLWNIAGLGMKKTPVGAGTFCPLSILVFYISPCWIYLPVSGARPSPCCFRKIPEKPQIKNVRKNCRRFTAWGGEVQDLEIFS
jgi:hypothetical protein